MKKKLILLSLAALFLASCTTSRDVVTAAAYKETNIAIKKELNSLGFMQSNQQSHSEFDGTYVTNTSTEKTTTTHSNDSRDRHDKGKNDTRTRQSTEQTSVTTENSYKVNTYCFQNEAGDRVEYQVKFYEDEKYDFSSKSDVRFCTDMALMGCSTSNIHDFDRVCGDDGIVSTNISNPRRERVSFFSELKATIYATVVLVGVVVLAAVAGALEE